MELRKRLMIYLDLDFSKKYEKIVNKVMIMIILVTRKVLWTFEFCVDKKNFRMLLLVTGSFFHLLSFVPCQYFDMRLQFLNPFVFQCHHKLQAFHFQGFFDISTSILHRGEQYINLDFWRKLTQTVDIYILI